MHTHRCHSQSDVHTRCRIHSTKVQSDNSQHCAPARSTPEASTVDHVDASSIQQQEVERKRKAKNAEHQRQYRLRRKTRKEEALSLELQEVERKRRATRAEQQRQYRLRCKERKEQQSQHHDVEPPPLQQHESLIRSNKRLTQTAEDQTPEASVAVHAEASSLQQQEVERKRRAKHAERKRQYRLRCKKRKVEHHDVEPPPAQHPEDLLHPNKKRSQDADAPLLGLPVQLPEIEMDIVIKEETKFDDVMDEICDKAPSSHSRIDPKCNRITPRTGSPVQQPVQRNVDCMVDANHVKVEGIDDFIKEETDTDDFSKEIEMDIVIKEETKFDDVVIMDEVRDSVVDNAPSSHSRIDPKCNRITPRTECQSDDTSGNVLGTEVWVDVTMKVDDATASVKDDPLKLSPRDEELIQKKVAGPSRNAAFKMENNSNEAARVVGTDPDCGRPSESFRMSYSCYLCGCRTTWKTRLSTLMRRHAGEKPFICGVCQSSFSPSHNLKAHKRTHTGEKKFVCDVCQSRFSRNDHMKAHKRTHYAEKPFVCDICDCRFGAQCTLTNHKRIHTGEKPFICDVCQSSFSLSSNLKAHKRTHTGEKKFVCDVCQSRFTRGDALKAHKRRHTATHKTTEHTAEEPSICGDV